MKKKPVHHTRKHAPHFYIIFAAVAVLVGVFATLIYTRVFAQTADVIYACVQKTSGNIRIVSASDSCKSNENALNWNQQGPQGTPGTPSISDLPFTCGTCYLYPAAERFKGKDLSYAQIWRTDFHGADLAGINFTRAYLSNNNFSDANLSNANFSDVDNFPGAGGMGGNFQNADLTNANFTNAKLQGASNMSTAKTTGVIWTNTTCPDGTNSDNNGNTCVGHL